MSEAEFQLAIERYIDAPPETVFKVWTEQLEAWWAPKPWTTEIVELDFRPGGRSAMIIRGPDGVASPMEGVILEVMPNQRIVFNNAFSVGWVPQSPFMVAVFTFAAKDGGTHYRAAARHRNAKTQAQQEEMGFIEGWSMVAGQLAELVEIQASTAAREFTPALAQIVS